MIFRCSVCRLWIKKCLLQLLFVLCEWQVRIIFPEAILSEGLRVCYWNSRSFYHFIGSRSWRNLLDVTSIKTVFIAKKKCQVATHFRYMSEWLPILCYVTTYVWQQRCVQHISIVWSISNFYYSFFPKLSEHVYIFGKMSRVVWCVKDPTQTWILKVVSK